VADNFLYAPLPLGVSVVAPCLGDPVEPTGNSVDLVAQYRDDRLTVCESCHIAGERRIVFIGPGPLYFDHGLP
jgi:hypothetical protein